MIINIKNIEKLQLFMMLYNYIQANTTFGNPNRILKTKEAAQALLQQHENDYCRFEFYCDISKDEVNTTSFDTIYGNGTPIFQTLVNNIKQQTTMIETHKAAEKKIIEDKIQNRIQDNPNNKADIEVNNFDITALLTILHLYQIPEGSHKARQISSVINSTSVGVSNNANNTTIYFYNLAELEAEILLRDQINYFLQHQNNANMFSDRNFVFFIKDLASKTISALIVKLTDCDLKIMDELKKGIQANNIRNYEEFVQKINLHKIKRLYAKKEFKWLGDPLTKPILDQLLAAIAKAYVGKIDLKPVTLPVKDRHSHLAAYVTTEFGLSKQPNFQAFQEENRGNLKKQYLQKIKNKFYFHITEQLHAELIIIFKYALVCSQLEKKLKDIQEKVPNLDEIEQIQQTCKLLKIQIYKKDCAIEEIIETFPLDLLLKLYHALDNITALHNFKKLLHVERQTRLQSMLTIEQNIDKRLQEILHSKSALLRHYTAKVLKFVYQTTLVEFGGSSLQFLTRSCSKRWNKNRVLQASRDKAKKFIRWSLKDKQNAEQWIKKFEQGIETYLSTNTLMYLIGAGVGAWCSMGMTNYMLFRQVLLAAGSLKLFNALQDSRIDNTLAKYSDSFEDITPLHCAYFVQVLIVMTEFHYTNDYRYVVRALGGATAGTGTVLYTCKSLPHFDKPATPELAQEAQIIKFFLNLGGHTLGYQLSDSLMFKIETMLDNRAMKREFQQYFKQLEQQNIFAELETREGHEENTVFLGWRYKGDSRWHSSQCRLQRKITAAQDRTLDISCTDPSISLPGIGIR